MASTVMAEADAGGGGDERAQLLRERARAFCTALRTSPAPAARELLAGFFVPDSSDPDTGAAAPSVREHGPSWATARLPFLGRDFDGRDGCARYLQHLAGTLRMRLEEDSFPGPHGFAVDAARGRVCVVGRGRFESVATGRSWDERFVYLLSGYDAEGRLGRWEIWADPLSAYAAVSSEDLDGWRKGEHRS